METKGKRAARDAGPVELPAGEPASPASQIASPMVAIAPALPPPLLPPAAEAEVPAPPSTPIVSSPAASSLAASPAAVAQVTKSLPAASFPAADFADFGHQALAALTESQTALAKALDAISVEFAGLARSGIDRAARTATDMLSIKTFSDAVGVNAVFARASFDTLVSGTAKLSELGLRLSAETSQPILTRLGKGWIAAARLGH